MHIIRMCGIPLALFLLIGSSPLFSMRERAGRNKRPASTQADTSIMLPAPSLTASSQPTATSEPQRRIRTRPGTTKTADKKTPAKISARRRTSKPRIQTAHGHRLITPERKKEIRRNLTEAQDANIMVQFDRALKVYKNPKSAASKNIAANKLRQLYGQFNTTKFEQEAVQKAGMVQF